MKSEFQLMTHKYPNRFGPHDLLLAGWFWQSLYLKGRGYADSSHEQLYFRRKPEFFQTGLYLDV